jgi:hypothetical protein
MRLGRGLLGGEPETFSFERLGWDEGTSRATVQDPAPPALR